MATVTEIKHPDSYCPDCGWPADAKKHLARYTRVFPTDPPRIDRSSAVYETRYHCRNPFCGHVGQHDWGVSHRFYHG